MRPWHAWAALTLASSIVLAAMAWISWTVLDLERTVRGQALLEENVRLALWRMDSSLAPLLAQESARPYFTYNSFYPAERAYTKMFRAIANDEILLPSPLLTQLTPTILVHFQFAPDGKLTSPQIPEGNMRDLAESFYTTHETIAEAAKRLSELEQAVTLRELLERVTSAEPGPVVAAVVQPPPVPKQGISQQPQAQQRLRSTQEWRARTESYRQAEELGNRARAQNAFPSAEQRDEQIVLPVATDVAEDGMVPLWVNGALLLARRVVVDKRTYVQGCWLDWPQLREELRESIQDLLPHAQLEAAGDEAARLDERRLAALPVRLVAGPPPEEAGTLLSPIRLSLLTSWGCVLVAVAAVAVLLRGVLSLSERRRVFVSAVTHELRTPLTTFRMYTDMLADGMVRDEDKKRNYLACLRREAERLGHLVENVLYYARLESGRAGASSTRVGLHDLLERVSERLRERVERAGMEIQLQVDPAESSLTVELDASALEQVLVNLVDNACKYAASAEERVIHLELGRADSRAVLRVRDHGPGVSRHDRQRLFRPFSKSDREAANSAPGVGLGLALSYRLARALGGELRLASDVADGACFELSLPLST